MAEHPDTTQGLCTPKWAPHYRWAQPPARLCGAGYQVPRPPSQCCSLRKGRRVCLSVERGIGGNAVAGRTEDGQLKTCLDPGVSRTVPEGTASVGYGFNAVKVISGLPFLGRKYLPGSKTRHATPAGHQGALSIVSGEWGHWWGSAASGRNPLLACFSFYIKLILSDQQIPTNVPSVGFQSSQRGAGWNERQAPVVRSPAFSWDMQPLHRESEEDNGSKAQRGLSGLRALWGGHPSAGTQGATHRNSCPMLRPAAVQKGRSQGLWPQTGAAGMCWGPTRGLTHQLTHLKTYPPSDALPCRVHVPSP